MSVTLTPIFFAAAFSAAARFVVSQIALMPCCVNLMVVMKVAIDESPSQDVFVNSEFTFAVQDQNRLGPGLIPSTKREPLLSGKAEPPGAGGVVGTARCARAAPLGTRVKARSDGGPGVVA